MVSGISSSPVPFGFIYRRLTFFPTGHCHFFSSYYSARATFSFGGAPGRFLPTNWRRLPEACGSLDGSTYFVTPPPPGFVG